MKVSNRSYILVLLIWLIFLGGCQALTTNQDSVTYKINDSEEKTHELEQRVQLLENQLKIYQDFCNSLPKSLDKETLLKISKSQWDYTLTVNNKPFPSNGILKVDNTNLDIQIAESSLPIDLDFLPYGGIENTQQKTYKDHLEIITSYHYTTTVGSGTTASAFNYKFSNIPKSSKIDIVITNALRERLNLNTCNLMIIVEQ